MKKVTLLFAIYIVILTILVGCNLGTHADPVETERFYSIEDFTARSMKRQSHETTAKLNALDYYFLPQNIPEGYILCKIVAGISDIGFWYLPEEYSSSTEQVEQGIADGKHFQFISSRGVYDFGSVMRQFDASTEDLIEGKYLIDEGSRDAIIWEQDGEVLMLTIPAELNYTDVLPYCTASKYVRNEKTQTFELEEESQ